MKIGGIGRTLYQPESIEQLKEILQLCQHPFMLGNGTNILFSEHYLPYDFITLNQLSTIKQIDQQRLFAPAGITVDYFLKHLADHNLGGYEKIAGIPGTLGGLLFMNGGAYKTTISDHLISVTCCDLNGTIIEIPREQLDFGYRTSPFQDRSKIIIGAKFKLKSGYDQQIEDDTRSKRAHNHPLEFPNLGSTFRNPEGYFAVKLLIAVGLKGYQIGDAAFSTKHTNFIINLGNATFDDVIALIKEAQKRVKDQFGIELKREILVVQ